MTASGILKPKSVAETHQLMKVALGEEKADLTVVNANVVNVYTGEILPDLGIAVKGKWIAYVGENAGDTIGPQTQVIDVNFQASDVFELEALMKQGEIVVGIYIPPDYERRLQQPERSAAQLLVDGSDTVVQSAAARIVRSARTSPFTDQPPVMEMRTYYNPERRSPVNTVPGLIGVILTMTMTLFTAVAIVRERERGNMELLITTPVRSVELMFAKILPYVFIGLVQVTLVLVLGNWLFDVPLRGALTDVYLVCLAFIIANLALGLVVSTVAQTQFQAMQMAFFILLPSILLSGFMFPFDGMPKAAQWIAEILPMTHFMRLIRGVVLRGAELSDLSTEMGIMWGFAAVAMTIAVLRFNKRLD